MMDGVRGETYTAREVPSDGSAAGRAVDRGRGERMGVISFVRGHWLEIMLGAALLGLGGYCAVLGRDNVDLKRRIEAEVSHSGTLARRVRELEERCQEKDSWFLTMTAEALRHGSSFAGKCMRDRRDYLNEGA